MEHAASTVPPITTPRQRMNALNATKAALVAPRIPTTARLASRATPWAAIRCALSPGHSLRHNAAVTAMSAMRKCSVSPVRMAAVPLWRASVWTRHRWDFISARRLAVVASSLLCPSVRRLARLVLAIMYAKSAGPVSSS